MLEFEINRALGVLRLKLHPLPLLKIIAYIVSGALGLTVVGIGLNFLRVQISMEGSGFYFGNESLPKRLVSSATPRETPARAETEDREVEQAAVVQAKNQPTSEQTIKPQRFEDILECPERPEPWCEEQGLKIWVTIAPNAQCRLNYWDAGVWTIKRNLTSKFLEFCKPKDSPKERPDLAKQTARPKQGQGIITCNEGDHLVILESGVAKRLSYMREGKLISAILSNDKNNVAGICISADQIF